MIPFTSFDPALIVWAPHPQYTGVRMAWLAKGAELGVSYSCALLEMADGAQIPEHIHADEDDVLYVLKGSARMAIGGEDIALVSGSFLRVPKGMPHRPHGFAGGFTIYDVWVCPTHFLNAKEKV